MNPPNTGGDIDSSSSSSLALEYSFTGESSTLAFSNGSTFFFAEPFLFHGGTLSPPRFPTGVFLGEAAFLDVVDCFFFHGFSAGVVLATGGAIGSSSSSFPNRSALLFFMEIALSSAKRSSSSATPPRSPLNVFVSLLVLLNPPNAGGDIDTSSFVGSDCTSALFELLSRLSILSLVLSVFFADEELFLFHGGVALPFLFGVPIFLGEGFLVFFCGRSLSFPSSSSLLSKRLLAD